jgi:hypothetical protein
MMPTTRDETESWRSAKPQCSLSQCVTAVARCDAHAFIPPVLD